MTTPKTTQLTASEWQAVCMRNVEELHNFLKSIQYPTDEAIAQIDQHMSRWSTFMRSWKLCAEQAVPKEPEAPQEAAQAVIPEAPKKKGGWPKGVPRKKKAETQMAVQ